MAALMNEGCGGMYDVSNILGATTWRIRFPNGNIKVAMVLS
jgi:hypothetical protein